MKKTWIALTLAGALCVPLAGCAGDNTAGDMTPSTGVSPTAQTTNAPNGTDDQQSSTDIANGGNNSGEVLEGDDAPGGDTSRSVTRGSTAGTGRADDSALERIGDGIKDTLEDMGSDARRMAQDAKRAME